MYEIFKPPKLVCFRDRAYPSIFLAGSIDNGTAENWQKRAEKNFYGWNVFNPRRDDWDTNWKQTASDPQFSQQVYWEMNALAVADYRLFNFVATSKSPITFLELGICLSKNSDLKNNYVVCPEEFYRAGNVEIICQISNTPLFRDLGSAIIAIKKHQRQKK